MESTGDECMDEFLLIFLGEKTFNSVDVSEMVEKREKYFSETVGTELCVTAGWLWCGLAGMQDPDANIYKEKLDLFRYKTKGAAEPDHKKLNYEHEN